MFGMLVENSVPPLTRLYTKGGDKGLTRLGGGQSVSKDDLRLESYGTVDELNSVIGVVLASAPTEELRVALVRIQHELFNLGSDLCFLEEDKGKWPIPQVEERHVLALEGEIDTYQAACGPLTNFILPGGTMAAAQLHVARTVCRRAERLVTHLQSKEAIGAWTLRYLNRLSDWLFAASRFENLSKGTQEPLWDTSV
jgi:cob(I)alamin adenosyltransferase